MDESIGTVAAAHHGYVTTTELYGLGYSATEIRTMVKRGTLIRARRGLYAAGHVPRAIEGRWSFAVRAAGEGAALDGSSALMCWGILAPRDRAVIRVVVPKQRRAVPGASIRVDARIDRQSTTEHRGVRVLRPMVAIAAYALHARPERVAAALREAGARGLLDLDELCDIADELAGRPGVANLRRGIELRLTGSAGARSAYELRVLDHVLRIVPELPDVNVAIKAGARTIEPDFAWPELRVCAEADGPPHDEPDVRREDLRRDRRLRAADWTVVRIHWRDFEADRDAAVAPLLAALERARTAVRP